MKSRFPLPKDAKREIRAAIDAGCVLEHGKKHAKLRSPCGKRFIAICGSPSDSDYVHILKREIRNLINPRVAA